MVTTQANKVITSNTCFTCGMVHLIRLAAFMFPSFCDVFCSLAEVEQYQTVHQKESGHIEHLLSAKLSIRVSSTI